MKFQLAHEELNLLIPADPAIAGHCRRVAALAREIAPRVPVSRRSALVLEQAAWLHHTPKLLFQSAALRRFIHDFLPDARALPARFDQDLPQDLEATLRAFHGLPGRNRDSRIRKMAEVLTLSNLLDEQLEVRPLEAAPNPNVWVQLEELRGLFEFDVLEAAHKALGSGPFGPGDSHWDLPPQAGAAQDVLSALTRHRDRDFQFLVALACHHVDLAARFLEIANSSGPQRRGTASSVQQAISLIGIDATRKLLLAMALQPLFESGGLEGAWRHSVWMAQYCEGLARLTGFLDPEDALIVGLVHDIGTVAIRWRRRRPSDGDAACFERDCPQVYVEHLQYGQDHGEVGAAILESWGLPLDLSDAIRFHHHPVDSPSVPAAALYLAEFWAEADEDMVSIPHLTAALARTGWTTEILMRVRTHDSSLPSRAAETARRAAMA